MIEEGERLYSLPTAFEKGTGVRPHPSTCHRHRIRGISGVKLETIKVGGRRMTSVEAVRRFNRAVTLAADGDGELPKHRTNRQRQADFNRDSAYLDSEGISKI